jgi:hypothetical protein
MKNLLVHDHSKQGYFHPSKKIGQNMYKMTIELKHQFWLAQTRILNSTFLPMHRN